VKKVKIKEKKTGVSTDAEYSLITGTGAISSKMESYSDLDSMK
jgi:hypothetical protein